MDVQRFSETVLVDLSAIRKEVEDLTNDGLHRAEAERDWRDNQKWQINDLRREVHSINSTVNWLLGVIVAALIYIAYRLT